jgi:hypothetical protein
MRSSPTALLKRVVPCTFVLCVSIILVACEAGETVIYHNETSVVLTAEVAKGNRRKDLPANEETGVGYIMSVKEPFDLTITDPNGCVVVALNTTLERLKQEADLQVTVTDSDLRSRCPNE